MADVLPALEAPAPAVAAFRFGGIVAKLPPAAACGVVLSYQPVAPALLFPSLRIKEILDTIVGNAAQRSIEVGVAAVLTRW